MAQRKRRRSHVNIPMTVAAVLLCLTLFSIHMSSGIFAKYSTVSDADDGARVIKFGDITLTTYGSTTQYIIPGTELVWNAGVTFEGSESATYVFLEVTPASGFQVTADGMNYTIPPAVPYYEYAEDHGGWTVDDTQWTCLKNDGGTYVCYKSLVPNEKLDNVPLFESNEAEIEFSLTAEQLETMGTITGTFRASVVQSNGFGSVGEAWTSLSTNH